MKIMQTVNDTNGLFFPHYLPRNLFIKQKLYKSKQVVETRNKIIESIKK